MTDLDRRAVEGARRHVVAGYHLLLNSASTTLAPEAAALLAQAIMKLDRELKEGACVEPRSSP